MEILYFEKLSDFWIFDFGKLRYNNNNNNNDNNKKAGLLGYPIRVILLVIFFGGKKVGEKLGYY